MVNFIEMFLKYAGILQQFNCGDNLITVFNCPLEARLMEKSVYRLVESEQFIFFMFIDGVKCGTQLMARSTFEGSCVFIPKGSQHN